MTDATRKAAERQRKKDAGMVRFDKWMHPDHAKALQRLLTKLQTRDTSQ
jgi:hypothetical protein